MMKEITSWGKPVRSKWPSDLRSKLRFTQVNLRSPILDGGWFSRAALIDCAFSGCDLGSPLFTKMDLERCTFDAANFGTAGVAVWKDVRCSDCTFVGSAIGHITFKGCSFKNVEFRSVNLGDLRFMQCAFEKVIAKDVRCGSVNFVEGTFLDTDFSGMQMRDCDLLNCKMDRSSWPDREDCFLVLPEQLVVVSALCEGKMPGDDYSMLSQLSAVFGKLKDPMIWDESLIEGLNPNARELVMKELFSRRVRK
jgi:uncharacterized protein YjbI with pentapeptide repeats